MRRGKRQWPQRTNVKIIKRKERWYEMVAMFDGEAKQVLELGGKDRVVMTGTIPPDDDVAICLVPPSVSNEQGLALQKILEANFRKTVLVLSNNIQMVRLKPISMRRATEIIERGNDGQVVQIARDTVAGEGEAVRAEDRAGHEGDLRPPGTAGATDEAGEGEAVGSSPGSHEGESGEAE
jgi:hypothetical protein